MSKPASHPMLIVVSGLSGSGKSVALRTLEDLDYYCVDNLPAELLTSFVQSMSHVPMYTSVHKDFCVLSASHPQCQQFAASQRAMPRLIWPSPATT